MNPYLPISKLKKFVKNATGEKNIETPELYASASEKFDIFHIAVKSNKNCYKGYAKEIQKTFGELLGPRLKISTVDQLAETIEECITESVNGVDSAKQEASVNENGEISW